MFGKCRFVMLIGAASISLAQTGSIPYHVATSGKPPMPSKSEPSFSVFASPPMYLASRAPNRLSPLPRGPVTAGWTGKDLHLA